MKKIFLFLVLLLFLNLNQAFSQDIGSLEFLSGKDYITFHSFGKTQEKQVFINTTNQLYGVSIQCVDSSIFEELDFFNFSKGYLVELKDFCSEYNLIVDLKVNNSIKRITKKIKVIESKFSSQDILDYEKWDNSFGNELQSAYAISSLIDFNKKTGLYSENILNSVEWLKSRRNNEGKCWPKDDCSLLQSFQIASFLKYANFNSFLIEYNLPESKLLTDIELWANSMNNYLKEDYIRLEISSDSQTNCTIETQDYSNSKDSKETSKDISFQTDYEQEFKIEQGRISVSCNNRVDVIFYDKTDKIIKYQFGTRDYSYEFHNGCWSEDEKWGSCSQEATIFGYYVANNDEILTQAKEYLDSKILTDQYYGNYLGNLKNSILYLLFVQRDEEIIKWVNYNQNNDGSWGSTSDEKYYLTPLALLAMYPEFGFERESIVSGLYWLSSNYDNLVEKDNLIYLSLFNKALYDLAIPTLKYNPPIIFSNELNSSFSLINPSYFDMELSFSIPDFVNESTFVKSDLILGYETKNYSFNFKNNLDVKKYEDFIYISTNNNFHFKIPLVLNLSPEIKFSSKDVLTYKPSFSFDVTTTYTRSNFNCNFSSENLEETFSKEFLNDKNTQKFKLDGILNEIDNNIKTTTILINYSCIDFYGYTKIGSFDFDVEFFPKDAFSIFPNSLNYTSTKENKQLIISNKLDDAQEISLLFKINDPYLNLYETKVTLLPFENKTIDIISIFPDENLFEWSNVLEIRNKVEAKDVRVSVFIEKEKSPLIKLAFIILFGSLLVISYYYRKKIILFFKKNNLKNLDIKKLFSKNKKEDIFNPDTEKEIIENLVNMLNLMEDFKKSKSEAVNELINQGFKEEEINYAIEKSNYNKKKETTTKEETK